MRPMPAWQWDHDHNSVTRTAQWQAKQSVAREYVFKGEGAPAAGLAAAPPHAKAAVAAHDAHEHVHEHRLLAE